MTPHTIGRYDVIAELGRGGMATVYHAHDPDFKRDVAIKIMPREFLHVPDFKTRFQREARTIAALEHDAIVPVYELGEHEDLPFLVMRYMGGGSLSDRIDREPLSVVEVINLFQRIALAIDLAHAQGFVHRDLKPDNILFDLNNNAFIADFGIAKLMHSTSQLTGSGALVGTPAYMSPEQIQGKGEVDHRSDLYSLGVILYEALTGQMPFKVDSNVGYFSAHLNEPVPDILDDNLALPPLFSSIIYKAMAKDKSDRYQSAAELADDVALALDPQHADAYLDDYETLMAETPPVKRVPYAVLGIGGLVVVGLVVLLSGVLGANPKPAQTESPVIQSTSDMPSTDLLAPTLTETPTESPSSTPNPLLAELADAGQILFNTAGTDDTGADIFMIDADGRDRIRLTIDNADDVTPTWSPDGSQIAFASDRNGTLDLYIMDADGSNLHQVTDKPGDQFGPAWSPDGTQLAYVADTPDTTTRNIYVINIDGSNEIRLTDDLYQDEYPAWSRDSSQIIFSSTRRGGYDIYTMDRDGSNVTRILGNVTTEDEWPTWSPDGRYIAYAQNSFTTTYQSVIIVRDLETAEDRELTPVLSQYIGEISWSPDGQYIAYFACPFGADTCPMYVIKTDGSHSVRIVGTGSGFEPAWRPNPNN